MLRVILKKPLKDLLRLLSLLRCGEHEKKFASSNAGEEKIIKTFSSMNQL